MTAAVLQLRAELEELHRVILDLIDPDAEVAYRRVLCLEAAAAERERSWSEGYVSAIADVKGAQHGVVGVLRKVGEVGVARWHLCCRACRRAGHRAGCGQCADRTRATFGQAHADDHLGGPAPWDGMGAAA
jgi:hypothetical protein